MSVGTRLLNRTGLGHGPLQRPVDRIEAWSRLALLLTFLIIVLPVTWSVATAVGHACVQQELTQRSDRHQVTARLLSNTASSQIKPGALALPALANAEWTGLDGSPHRGVVHVEPGKHVGSTQVIWTDLAGRPVPAPQGHDDTVASVAGTVFLTPVLIGGLIAGFGGLIHRYFDRRRYRQWDAAWEQVGPDWSRRR